MIDPSYETPASSDAPFLQNRQGWKFFPEAVEIHADEWRGLVRIHPGAVAIMSRMRCTTSRSTVDEALEDAKALAQVTFHKIAEKLRVNDELERERKGLCCDP